MSDPYTISTSLALATSAIALYSVIHAPKSSIVNLAAFSSLVLWLIPMTVIAPLSPGIAGALVTVLTGSALALTRLLRRFISGRESLLVAAAAVAIPFRIPVPLGDATARLLLPLYVVTIILIAHLAVNQNPGIRQSNERSLRFTDAAILGFYGWSALSLMWAHDPVAGQKTLLLLITPFAILYAVIRRYLACGESLRTAAYWFACAIAISCTAGLIQITTNDVWWNQKVIVANEFGPVFRTNSLFWDPNIYGRYLVLGMLIIIAALAASRFSKQAQAPSFPTKFAGVSLGILISCLWFTWSQSSWIALGAGLFWLAIVTADRRARIVLLAFVVIAAAMLPAGISALRGDDTRDRRQLVRTGLTIASKQPLRGVGIGGFEKGVIAAAKKKGEHLPKLRASHTTPATIAAELGLVGLLLYTLIFAAFLLRSLTFRVEQASTAQLTLFFAGGASFIAISAQSMLYASWIEDPATWFALALAMASASNPVTDQKT